MSTRTFALVLGIIFLVVGICGFIPPFLVQREHGHDLQVNAFEGYLFGLFHVNVLHSLVHVAFGIAGIAMSRRFSSARFYAQFTAVAYLLLAIMGFIPALNTFFGLIPIHGNDIWLHLIIAAAAGYYGFVHRSEREYDTAAVHRPAH